MLKFPLPLTQAPPPAPLPWPRACPKKPATVTTILAQSKTQSLLLTSDLLSSTHPPVHWTTRADKLFLPNLGREEFNMIRTGSHILSHLTFCKVIFQNWHVLSNQYFHSQTRSTAKLPNHIIGCHNWIHNYLMLYLSSFFAHNLCGLMSLMQKTSFFCIHIVFLDLICPPPFYSKPHQRPGPEKCLLYHTYILFFSVFVLIY